MHARSVVQQPTPAPTPPPAPRICARPGCTAPIKRGSLHYCSRRCADLNAAAATTCAAPSCPTHLTPTQIRRKQRYCSRACYAAHRWDRSLKKQSHDQGLCYVTVLTARAQQRIAEINGELKIYSPTRCGACERAVGMIGSNRLCVTCKAAGLRWCGTGNHAVPQADYWPHSRTCTDHKRLKSSRTKLRQRGVDVDPPHGYVPIAVIAKQLGYSVNRVRAVVRAGWMRGKVWQRCPEGRIFILKQDSYPSWRKYA